MWLKNSVFNISFNLIPDHFALVIFLIQHKSLEWFAIVLQIRGALFDVLGTLFNNTIIIYIWNLKS